MNKNEKASRNYVWSKGGITVGHIALHPVMTGSDGHLAQDLSQCTRAELEDQIHRADTLIERLVEENEQMREDLGR